MNNYCTNLFNSIYIVKVNRHDVKLGHCCASKLDAPSSIVDFNNDFLTNNRNFYTQTGELPKACNQCVNNEKNGIISKRITDLKNIASYSTVSKLKQIDYNCDNICNLKCIMCNSICSSAWIDDAAKLGILNQNYYIADPTKHNVAITGLDVSELETIYFNGGEPWMTKDHINVLTYIKNNTNTKNVEVRYSTNGTFPVTKEMVDLWKNFKSIYVGFSIDAYGEAFEYIRNPGKWKEVEANILHFIEIQKLLIALNCNVNFHLGVTIGVQNIMHVRELVQWANTNAIKIHIQGGTLGPNNLSLANFPFKHKDKLIAYLTNIDDFEQKQVLIDACTRQITETNSLDWVSYLNKLDEIRGNSWKQSLNNLYNIDPALFDSYK
jgi:pyruvate-formate lyase-activating enzyme